MGFPSGFTPSGIIDHPLDSNRFHALNLKFGFRIRWLARISPRQSRRSRRLWFRIQSLYFSFEDDSAEKRRFYCELPSPCWFNWHAHNRRNGCYCVGIHGANAVWVDAMHILKVSDVHDHTDILYNYNPVLEGAEMSTWRGGIKNGYKWEGEIHVYNGRLNRG